MMLEQLDIHRETEKELQFSHIIEQLTLNGPQT